MTEESRQQQATQRRRNATSVRITVIGNGYLLRRCSSADQQAHGTRQQLHAHLDRLLDQIERESAGDSADLQRLLGSNSRPKLGAKS